MIIHDPFGVRQKSGFVCSLPTLEWFLGARKLLYMEDEVRRGTHTRPHHPHVGSCGFLCGLIGLWHLWENLVCYKLFGTSFFSECAVKYGPFDFDDPIISWCHHVVLNNSSVTKGGALEQIYLTWSVVTAFSQVKLTNARGKNDSPLRNSFCSWVRAFGGVKANRKAPHLQLDAHSSKGVRVCHNHQSAFRNWRSLPHSCQ